MAGAATAYRPKGRGLLLPSWLPVSGGVAASPYADFANGRYWFGAQKPDFATWLAALSGTFARSSTAYYTNSAGVLVSAASGALRFDYDPVSLVAKGILLEGARTNVWLQSNTLSDASWIKSSATVAQNVVGPDGAANSAWTVTSTSTVFVVGQNITGASTSAPSIYVKLGTAPFFFIQVHDGGGGVFASFFNLSTGANGTQNVVIVATPALASSNASLVPVGNGWYRLKLTITGGAPDQILYGFSNADGSRTVTSGLTGLLYGGMLENSASFPSSYIPTTSASVTRAADALTLGPTAPWLGTVGHGIIMDATFKNSNNFFLGHIRNSADSIFIDAPVRVDSSLFHWFNNGPSASNIQNAAGTVTPGTAYKIGATYGSGANSGFVNGTAYTTTQFSTNGAPPTGMDRWDIAQDEGFGAASQFNGNLRSLTYFPFAPSSAEMIRFTR